MDNADSSPHADPTPTHQVRAERPPDPEHDLAAIANHQFTMPTVVPAATERAPEPADW
jgi:hypothetical protein